MAAATQNNGNLSSGNGPGAFGIYKVAASTKIYQNTLVCTNASGYLVPASNTAGLRFVGIANSGADNSAGANGDITCNVIPPCSFVTVTANITSPTQAVVGALVYASDDLTVTATVGNGVVIGQVQSIALTGTAGQVVVDTTIRN